MSVCVNFGECIWKNQIEAWHRNCRWMSNCHKESTIHLKVSLLFEHTYSWWHTRLRRWTVSLCAFFVFSFGYYCKCGNKNNDNIFILYLFMLEFIARPAIYDPFCFQGVFFSADFITTIVCAMAKHMKCSQVENQVFTWNVVASIIESP